MKTLSHFYLLFLLFIGLPLPRSGLSQQSTAESSEALPIVAIVAAYDTFASAPTMATTGADQVQSTITPGGAAAVQSRDASESVYGSELPVRACGSEMPVDRGRQSNCKSWLTHRSTFTTTALNPAEYQQTNSAQNQCFSVIQIMYVCGSLFSCYPSVSLSIYEYIYLRIYLSLPVRVGRGCRARARPRLWPPLFRGRHARAVQPALHARYARR
jgi:hypothetical protein